MIQTTADIPAALQADAEAALGWINSTQGRDFELTGVVDYDAALAAGSDAEREFGLVLCDGEICAREQVRLTPHPDGVQFSFVAAAERDIPPLLDPPAGVRADWLERVLARHEFVLLLFYRGLW